MPYYAFRCKSCGAVQESKSNVPRACPKCGSLMQRDYHFNIGRSFRPHFNHSVGRFVRTQTEFNDALKRAGDKNETVYSPIDMHEAPGVNDEGMDATRKQRRDSGIDPPTKRIIT